ncbi:MAG TPA: toll/interleukin-1 receptor domain-containing protein [Oceanobacillus sp.]|nr:toll/interleukin-1 receptor domain-containing protein [Oceanobacillus sp.]
MSAADPIIEALTEAASRLSEPEVRAAYEQLVHVIETHLVQEPFLDESAQPLTETQLVFIRHGLRGLASSARGSMSAWSDVQQAAESLSQVVMRNTVVNIGQQVIQSIDTVSGGNVVMTGITNYHNAVPEPPDLPEFAPPVAQTQQQPTKRKHDIFLSYSRKDARIMRRLFADLKAAGFTIWTDEDLTPGTPSWVQAIESAIQSSGCLVVILTPDSKKSPWVERELVHASAYGIPIFPLLARGDERSSVPLVLSSHQWADIRRERDYRMSTRKLIRAVRGRLAKLNEMD